MVATQHKLVVLTPDLTSKDHHISVYSGHHSSVMEPSDCTSQSTDPAQLYSNHYVSLGFVLIPWCFDRKVETFKWKEKESPFS